MSTNKQLKEGDLRQNRSAGTKTRIGFVCEKKPGCIIAEVEARGWLESLRLRKCSEKTVAVYGNAIGALRVYLGEQGKTALVDVVSADLEAWRLSLVKRGCAVGTLETYARAARHWFKWLTEHGSLFENPAASFVVPLGKRRLLPVPSVEEMRRLLAAPNPASSCGLRDRAILEVAYATGARREELFALDIHDIDLGQGTLRVLGKGRKERVLPLTKSAVKWLSGYTEKTRPKLLKGKIDEAALWIDLHGKRVSYQELHSLVKRHAKAAGIAQAVTPHTLRRACATHLLQNGAHAVQLQLLLGHATLKHLSQYLRLSIAELQATHARSKPGH
jgi:integrase/recombinase XerD